MLTPGLPEGEAELPPVEIGIVGPFLVEEPGFLEEGPEGVGEGIDLVRGGVGGQGLRKKVDSVNVANLPYERTGRQLVDILEGSDFIEGLVEGQAGNLEVTVLRFGHERKAEPDVVFERLPFNAVGTRRPIKVDILVFDVGI